MCNAQDSSLKQVLKKTGLFAEKGLRDPYCEMRFLFYIAFCFFAPPAGAEDMTEPVEAELLAHPPQMEPSPSPAPSPAPVAAAAPKPEGPATKASAMRDVKLAADAKDYPGMIRGFDKLLPFFARGSQDRLLQKAELAILKVTDPVMLELLRSQVTDDRMKQRLASRQLASAQVVVETMVPVARYARFQIDPYFATSPFSFRDNRTGINSQFGSPTQYGVELGGAFHLASSLELGWRAGYHSLSVLAPAGKTMAVKELSLYGGQLDLGWFVTSDRALRLSLGTSLERLPFILAPDATTLQMIGAFMPAATFRLSYEMALSDGFSLTWQGYTEYLISALTSSVRNGTGYGGGGDIVANIGLSGNFWITLSGRFHYQNISTSATSMTRYWAGGGLGVLIRFAK